MARNATSTSSPGCRPARRSPRRSCSTSRSSCAAAPRCPPACGAITGSSTCYGIPVHTFVLYLRGGPPGVQTNVYSEISLGAEICRFHYRSLGLGGAAAEDYLARPEPLAWTLAALMRWPTGDRHAQRRACLDRIARAGHLDGARSFLLFNCVATYLKLDGRAAEVYRALLAEHGNEEGRTAMKTWAEEFKEQLREEVVEEVRQKVRHEVLQERQQEEIRSEQRGMREVLLRQLRLRFGPLRPEVPRRVSAITSTEELARLAERVLSAGSLEELGLS